jgi:hypothetical protein
MGQAACPTTDCAFRIGLCEHGDDIVGGSAEASELIRSQRIPNGHEPVAVE